MNSPHSKYSLSGRVALFAIPKDVIIITNYVDMSMNLSPKSEKTVLPVGNARKVNGNLAKAITGFALPLYLVTFWLAN